MLSWLVNNFWDLVLLLINAYIVGVSTEQPGMIPKFNIEKA